MGCIDPLPERRDVVERRRHRTTGEYWALEKSGSVVIHQPVIKPRSFVNNRTRTAGIIKRQIFNVPSVKKMSPSRQCNPRSDQTWVGSHIYATSIALHFAVLGTINCWSRQMSCRVVCTENHIQVYRMIESDRGKLGRGAMRQARRLDPRIRMTRIVITAQTSVTFQTHDSRKAVPMVRRLDKATKRRVRVAANGSTKCSQTGSRVLNAPNAEQ